MKIGDVDLPCVSSFDIADTNKKTETIAPLGTDLHTVVEFDPEPVPVEISGTLFKKLGGSKDADDFAEDLAGVAGRRSVFNYVHNIQGVYGFVAVDKCNVDPRETTKTRRGFTLSGTFLPLSEYWGRIDAKPVIRPNAYGILLAACSSWVQIPRLAHYATDGNTRTLDSEYGTLTQTSGSYVNFMPTGTQDGIGEVRAFDGTQRIYKKSHWISGVLTVSNGLYKVSIDRSNSAIEVSYWSGSGYTKIDTFTVDAFAHLVMEVCRPDIVEVVLSNGMEISLEAGRVPMIDAETLTCDVLTPADQTTVDDNYLTLGSNLYVASDQALEIASSVVSGPGKKWIFHATTDVAQEAKNCLVDLRAIWHVVRRW